MHMLKNIAKTTLKTLDEITMTSSVDEKKLLFEPKNDSNEPEKETMMEDEAAATKVAADAAAAAVAAKVATTDNVVSAEDEEEKKQEEKKKAGEVKDDQFDPNLYASKADYLYFTTHYRMLIQPAKKFNLKFSYAVQYLTPNSTLSEVECKRIVDEMQQCYDDLEQTRYIVIRRWKIEAQESDKYLEPYFQKMMDVRALFDVKFVQTPSQSSKGSVKHHSTAIGQGANVELAADQLGQLSLEEQRRLANEERNRVQEAEKSILLQQQQMQEDHIRRCEDLQRQHEKDLAALAHQRQQLLEGGQHHDLNSRVSSPVPSITSSLLPPPLPASNVVPSPHVQHQPLVPLQQLQPLPPRVALPSQRPLQQPLSQKTLAPNQQMEAFSDLVSTFASQTFDPRSLVKIFKGDKPSENYQNYALWRSQWRTCERKMLQLRKDKFEMYTALSQVLEGEAARVIGTPEIREDTYDIMLKKLDNRYSNPSLFLKEVTNQLGAMPKMTDTKESLMRGINTLESGWENLRARNLSQDHLTTMYFIHMYEGKLSPNGQKLWITKKLKNKDDSHPLGFNLTIQDFFDTLHDAELSELHTPDTKNKNDDKGKRNTMFGSHASESQEEEKGNQCIIPKCQAKQHKYILRCPELQKIPPLELLAWANKNNISCKLCLSKQHKTESCDHLAAGRLHKCSVQIQEGPRKGTECGGLHCKFLHFDVNPKKKKKKEQGSNQSHQTSANPSGPPPPSALPLVQNSGFYIPPEMLQLHGQNQQQLALPAPQASAMPPPQAS